MEEGGGRERAMANTSQINKYYFDHPDVFEEVNRHRYDPECEFLKGLFQAQGGISHVLDAACGTGAHAARLTQAGYAVTGVDLNPNMVAYAREHHPGLDFQLADMRDLPFSAAFEAVICLCTSFSYNRTNEEVVAALQSFRRALRGGGLLVIDVFNVITLIEKRPFLPERREEEHYARLGLVSFWRSTVDERRQLLVVQRTISRVDSGEALQTDLTEYRMFFPQELRYFLETNGFKLLEFYSGFGLEQKNLEGSRLIAVAVRL